MCSGNCHSADRARQRLRARNSALEVRDAVIASHIMPCRTADRMLQPFISTPTSFDCLQSEGAEAATQRSEASRWR